MTDQLVPIFLDSKAPSTPPHFGQHKHHDHLRETDHHNRELAIEARAHLVLAMRSKAVWLPPQLFQEVLLPNPPPSVMLTDKQLNTLTKKLEEMHKGEGYKVRARQAEPSRQPEDQLALELTEIVNEYILDVVKGKSTKTTSKSGKAAQLTQAVKRTVSTRFSRRLAATAVSAPGPSSSAASGSPSSASISPYPVTLVPVVPHYVMRLSPHKYDQSDVGMNKADAAMFRNDIVRRLKKGRPNWAYQRLFGEFKLSGPENDPFEDGELKDTQPAAGSREKVRGQLIAYADRVFLYQHRTAVFSYFVTGREFRFFRWDRAGVFVTQKVDYVEDTRTFVEFLLGFVVLDDASQGIDTTVTLLEKGSRLYKLMDSLAKADGKVLKMRVLSYDEGDVLPEDIPVETVHVSHPSSPAHEHDSSAFSDGDVQQDAASDSAGPAACAATRTVRRPKEGSFVFKYVLDYFASSIENNWPRYQVPIGSDTFLIARPIFETTGLVGRGTRGYVAWHVQSESFVFLKDAWRPLYKGVEMEGDILRGLNEAGVEHIPTLLCHGQVASQETWVSHYAQNIDTRTNDERKAESRSKTGETSKGKKRTREDGQRHLIRHYAHHRLATKEVCLPLVAFRSSKQLVSLVNDCVEGHAEAFNKRGLIHRDISTGNMLILPGFESTEGGELRVVWRGLLCDWELSKPKAPSTKDEKARQPERTGTWKYMSVASLKDVLHIVDISDEIESFFNVIIYNAVRYLPHLYAQHTSEFVSDYFNGHKVLPNGDLTVGQGKVLAITMLGHIPIGPLEQDLVLTFGQSETDQNLALNSLIRMLLTWFKARYTIMKYEEKVKPSTSSDETSSADGPTDPQLSLRPAQRPRIQSGQAATWGQAAPNVRIGPPRPSDETYEDAARLQNHDDFRSLLRYALDEWAWPEYELKSDHLNGAEAVFNSPLDGMSVNITPSASTPGTGAALNYSMAPVRDPHNKHRPGQTARRSTTGSGSLQLAWDRSGTT